MYSKPSLKPNNPLFSSGPCPKRPGWSLSELSNAILGRSHRSKIALERIYKVISLIRETLNIPSSYQIGIVPASDTGAIEMLLWNLLGERPVDVLAWESFGNDWVKDIVNQLKIENTRVIKAYVIADSRGVNIPLEKVDRIDFPGLNELRRNVRKIEYYDTREKPLPLSFQLDFH